MQPFRHDRLARLTHLLQQANAVLRKYNSADLDLPQAVTGFLDEAVASYAALGLASGENTLLTLHAQFVSAQGGTNPISLEQVKSHRRSMARTIALHVLQQASNLLQTDAAELQKSLADTRLLLTAVVLNAAERNLIVADFPTDPSLQQLGSLWTALAGDTELKAAAHRVALLASPTDILLLLGELLKELRP